jgi:hypothetical protein
MVGISGPIDHDKIHWRHIDQHRFRFWQIKILVIFFKIYLFAHSGAAKAKTKAIGAKSRHIP